MSCQALRLGIFAFLALTAYSADFAAGLSAYQAKDYLTAAREWTPLAEKGHPAAQFNLGLLYLDGTGVPQDPQQAILWFRRSADQGYAKAQYNLGVLLAAGEVVKRDPVNAHMWFNLCAAAGDGKCARKRDELASSMRPKDVLEARKRATRWKAVPEEQPKKP